MCFSCNLKLVPVAQASEYKYTIPIQEVSSKSSRCKFKVMFCSSEQKVNQALGVVGIKIKDMNAMEKLADYYDSGQAKAFYKVDLSELLDKIVFSPEEEGKTECQIACTY